MFNPVSILDLNIGKHMDPVNLIIDPKKPTCVGLVNMVSLYRS